SSNAGVAGQGLTVTLLQVDLDLLPALLGGINLLTLDIATADAFLGDVVPDPTPTATATPTTPPPAPTATPTATPPAGSTATPTSTPQPGSTATPTATPQPGSTATPTATTTRPPEGSTPI